MRPMGRFRDGFVIVGDSMQTSLLSDMTVLMKRIGRFWTSSIPSMSFLLKLYGVVDSFAQVSAQRDVSLPRRRPSTAYCRPHNLHTVI